MKKAKLIDGDGVDINVGDIELYSIQLENTLLVTLYKTTIYQHELRMVAEELVEKKLLEMEKDQPKYNPILTLVGIKTLQEEIVNRWDEKTHDKIVSNIDLSFLDKKPKNL
jgi:hypothetical protein